MKKIKKILLVFCVLAILLSYLDSSIIWYAYAENTETENTETKKKDITKELTAPQNLHEENGFIIWDETPDAYGYSVKACKDDLEINIVHFTNRVELKRFFYENNMEFGEYTFEVCAFDETNTMSEYSNQVTAVYAPTLDTPANVRLSEDGKNILWDEVTGSVRYNTHIFKRNDNNEREEIEGDRWEIQNLLSVEKYVSGANGDYWYAFQAMDEDYNVSEWTEPILVSYKSNVIGVPKNVRFDDTGESILWDEVDGATSYVIQVSPFFGDSDFGYSFSRQSTTSKNQLDNWKSLTVPFADEYFINVRAEAEGYISIVVSDSLRIDYSPVHDEMINVPENIWLEDDCLRWDEIEGVKEY